MGAGLRIPCNELFLSPPFLFHTGNYQPAEITRAIQIRPKSSWANCLNLKLNAVSSFLVPEFPL